jgi:hypothetical protein
MGVCPGCHAEYRSGIENCSECHLELIDSLPEVELVETGKDTELVELASFHTVSEAEMAQELLGSNEIDTALRGAADPIGSASGAEPIVLLVQRHNLLKATEIYEAYFAGEAEAVQDQPTEEE